MKKKKRLFAILLAFCVVFTMMPLTGSGGVAHAEDEIAATMQPTRTTMLDLTYDLHDLVPVALDLGEHGGGAVGQAALANDTHDLGDLGG